MIFLQVFTSLSESLDVKAENLTLSTEERYLESNDENWIEWKSGPIKINFTLNDIVTEATVTMSGNPVTPTGYGTNANQFGVILKMNGQNYTYTFADGSAESSGVFFAIEGNGNASPYILRPNSPITNNGAQINPNEVRTDYKFYYSDTKVKEETTVTLSTGESIAFTQIVEFRNDGVFHKSYFKNIGNDTIPNFRGIAKVDAYLVHDYVPVYYGEYQHVYYIKQDAVGMKLRVTGLNGVDGSIAAPHQRIWQSGFIDTYRYYNASKMEYMGTSGNLALSGADSEMVFDQRPTDLEVGEIREITFVINYLVGASVTVNYVDENGISIAETEFLQGAVGQSYQANRKEIVGYTLLENALPSNEIGTFQTYEQEVRYVYKQNEYRVKYDGNGANEGVDTIDEKSYHHGDYATVLDNLDYQKEHHRFVGWNTRDDGTGATYQVNDHIEMTSDVTLYAMWEANLYHITYDGNGNTAGNVPIDDKEYLYGENASILNSGDLEKNDFQFIGWNTKVDGSGEQYQLDDTLEVFGDTTLYAMWGKKEIKKNGTDESSKTPNSETSTADNQEMDLYLLLSIVSLICILIFRKRYIK
ncbi:MAG: InlB B-repeat-containing protein [Coprobacillaceae bacterium]